MPFFHDHLHLRSADPQGAVEFYQRMFGAKVGERVESPGGGMTFLDINGMVLIISGRPATGELSPASLEPHYGLDHFGLKTEDLEQAAAELKAKGAEFLVEPSTSRPGVKYAFVRAPDDVRIELVERNAQT